MDAFNYIIDMFAIASDEEGLPTNEENLWYGPGAGPLGCVVAWDASLLIHIWRTATTSSYVFLFILGSNIIIINTITHTGPHHNFHSTSTIVAFRSFVFLFSTSFESVLVCIFYSISTYVYVCSFLLWKEDLPFLCKFKWEIWLAAQWVRSLLSENCQWWSALRLSFLPP